MVDCVSKKIDSNATGLSFAEEICAGQLPNFADDGRDPVWYLLEPNEYDDFGGDVSTFARRPLSATRQRKKGTITDVGASFGFGADYTQNNHNRLLRGFFFADYAEKATTKTFDDAQVIVTGAVAATDRITAANGLNRFRVGQYVSVSGFTIDSNNGLKRVTSVDAAGTYIGVAEALEDEAATTEIIVTAVGVQLGNEAVSVAFVGGLPVLTLGANPVAATGLLTITATFNAVAGEHVSIGGTQYTFVAGVPANAYEVQIGASRLQTIANLATTINGGSNLTPQNPSVSATNPGDGTMPVTARVKGTVGNLLATAEDMTNGAWGGATLSGGTGFSWLSLGLQVGEWVYSGGDGAGHAFAVNTGFARIKALTDTAMTFDKTSWDNAAAEIATGVQLDLFYGMYLVNARSAEESVTYYYQFERTLGNDGDGIQAEYGLGAVANELELTFPLPEGDEARITAALGFIGIDTETRTGAEGRKVGQHVKYAAGEAAYNTSLDQVRQRLQIINSADSLPLPLFAWVQDSSLTINNNVSPVKAQGALGGIDVNVGNFDVGGEITALFTTVNAIRAIRQNRDITYDVIHAHMNEGFVYDIPLLTLGGGMPNIELDEPVTLPVTMMAAENDAGYTISYTNFPYLPNAAMRQ